MNKEYQRICEDYPLLSRVVRNSLMSEVTNSAHKSKDRKEVLEALKKFKKKKRLKIIELFLETKSDTKTFMDIIPNVVKFFNKVNKITK